MGVRHDSYDFRMRDGADMTRMTSGPEHSLSLRDVLHSLSIASRCGEWVSLRAGARWGQT